MLVSCGFVLQAAQCSGVGALWYQQQALKMLWNAHYHCHCGSGMIHREIFEYPASPSEAANHLGCASLSRTLYMYVEITLEPNSYHFSQML